MEQELIIEREENKFNRIFQVESNNMDISESNHHNSNNKFESQIMRNTSSTSSSSLKELCGLLLSSFCGILDDFGLETQADEQMLLMAIESGDFDSVIEYVKLFRNKISSILLLNNISRYSREDIDIINDVDNLQDSGYDQVEEFKRNSIHDHITNIDSSEFQRKIDLNNQEYGNLKLLSPNSIANNNNNSSNIKKSPVPPLNVEKAGPGSWNRGQLPNEYPIE